MKIANDKYYTPIDLANKCWSILDNTINLDDVTEIIEPSCGDGAFYHYSRIPDYGYDIEPELDSDNVYRENFLNNNLSYKKGRLFIGNPPYGNSNSLAINFYNKCCELGDYIAFILPISQFNNNLQMYKFNLIHSYDLGIQVYSGKKLHCCFNVYKRPENGLNSKPNVKLRDVTIVEHRRKKGQYSTGKNKDITDDYDYAICNWGNGSIGKVPEYIGQYAQEVYFYCHNKKYKNDLIKILQRDVLLEYCKSISMKKISVARLYIYIKNNIDGIQ